MRFGVFLTLDHHPAHHPPKPEFLREALDLAEFCDELGLDVWVAEHHFSDYGVTPSPAAFLAAAAQRTRRVRLGSAVAVLSVSHPLRVAEDFAFVDAVSGGRLEFGVGSGYLAHELRGFGVAPEEKRERLDAALDIVLRAWAGETIRSDGPFWTIPEARLNLLPVQRPHPPVWVGTTRPEPAPFVGRAGRHLLAVPYVAFPDRDALARSVAAYRAARRESGPGEGRVAVACHAFVGQEPRRPRRGGADPASGAAATGRAAANELDGVPREYREAEAALELYLKTRIVPGARVASAHAPADFVLFGDAGEVASGVAGLRDCGVDTVLLLCHFGGLSAELARASLERFARRVAPRFREEP